MKVLFHLFDRLLSYQAVGTIWVIVTAPHTNEYKFLQDFQIHYKLIIPVCWKWNVLCTSVLLSLQLISNSNSS